MLLICKMYANILIFNLYRCMLVANSDVRFMSNHHEENLFKFKLSNNISFLMNSEFLIRISTLIELE